MSVSHDDGCLYLECYFFLNSDSISINIVNNVNIILLCIIINLQ